MRIARIARGTRSLLVGAVGSRVTPRRDRRVGGERKPGRLTFGLLFALAFVLASGAFADPVRVEVRNAPPGASVEAQVSGAGVADNASATADGGGDLSMLLEMGSLGKARPVEVEVYQNDCGGQRSLVLVAEGGDAPRCEEEQAGGDGNCRCRRIGAFWLRGGKSVVKIDWQTGAVSATGGKTGLLLGGGVDFVKFGGKDPALDPAFSRELSTDDSDSGYSLFGEYAFLPWLAVGLGYEELGKIGLSGTLTYLANPSLQVLSRGEIDPWAAEVYFRLSRWMSPRTALSLMAGAAYWEADSKSEETYLVNGSPVDSYASKSKNEGWSPYLGASFDVWFRNWLGMRVAYKWIKMNQDANSSADRGEIDRTAQALRLLVIFGF